MVRRRRSQDNRALSDLPRHELLIRLLQDFARPEDEPLDVLAISLALAVWMAPGPDCSDAVELLAEAGAEFGGISPEDLEDVRRSDAFQKFKVIVAAQRDANTMDEDRYCQMRDCLIEAGTIWDDDDVDETGADPDPPKPHPPQHGRAA